MKVKDLLRILKNIDPEKNVVMQPLLKDRERNIESLAISGDKIILSSRKP